MKPPSFMVIAGEPSGDLLAAELLAALRTELMAARGDSRAEAQPLRTGLEPRFFGAGGSHMKAAGADLAFDLTRHSVIGFSDVLRHYLKFRRLFHQLLRLALERQPDVIIGVDYGGFNLRFARAIQRHVRSHRGIFNNWRPKIVQFVSPQVWASRAGRAHQMERDHDLLLSIFPFEKDWYARRVPRLRVEFVGHPMMGRFAKPESLSDSAPGASRPAPILLLPGSRTGELQRHLPPMLGAVKIIREQLPAVTVKMVLPNSALVQLARSLGTPGELEIQTGNLPQALAQAGLAIASTGTVTMECAFFGVPTVTLYRTSRLTYEIGRRIVKVQSLTMPNLLAGGTVFPEFIQDAATPENLAGAALELLRNDRRRVEIQAQLKQIIASLGGPGAAQRAAQAIAKLVR